MYYLGIDIGGTKCSVSLGKKGNPRMSIMDKYQFPTCLNNPEEIINRFFIEIDTILEANSLSIKDISGIGITCGGPLDSKRGVILSPPNLPKWDNIPIIDLFEKKFGIKTYVHNDANACAIAEWKFGAGRGLENIIFITFGTGLGAGIILSGHLYTGTNDMAGEIGHIRLTEDGPVGYGKNGSMEGFCSGGGISKIGKTMAIERDSNFPSSRLYELADDPEKINAKMIADFADEGDKLCMEIYRISGEKLGKGLSILIDVLNPEMIIIGSIFTRSYKLLWDSTKKAIEKEALPRSLAVCKITTSQLGDDVGDYAALSVAMGEF
jgi:glucokinase